MRLIDADALRDALGITGTADSCKGCKYHSKYGCGYDATDTPSFEYVCEMIDDAPSIQSEGIYYVKFSEEDYEKIAEQLRKIPIVLTLSEPEIVRCAECKWFQCNMRFDGHLPKSVDEFECRHWCSSCDPTDFCSYAERREE